MSEKMQRLEQKSSDLASAVSIWRSFTDSAGWQLLLKMLEAGTQLDPQPLTDINQVLGQEFEKGKVAAFRLIMRMPELQLELAKEGLELLEKEIQRESEIESERTARASSGSSDRRSNGWGGTEPRELLDPGTDPFGSA